MEFEIVQEMLAAGATINDVMEYIGEEYIGNDFPDVDPEEK